MIIYIIICYYIVIITYCYDIILHIKFMLLHIITYSVITHYYYFCYYMREGCSLRGRVGRGVLRERERILRGGGEPGEDEGEG